MNPDYSHLYWHMGVRVNANDAWIKAMTWVIWSRSLLDIRRSFTSIFARLPKERLN